MEDGTTSLEVRASVPSPDGYLVVHDSWDPYWTATVDGAPAQVVRANGLFRAVHLTAGEHSVRFAYEPTPFHIGLGVSLGTCVLLLLLAASRLGDLHLYTRPHGQEEV
ncbi:MAG: YfhO family protein [Acidobacteria bacterium]|nr:YfhO family protein [Acidobacteriota bacterium]